MVGWLEGSCYDWYMFSFWRYSANAFFEFTMYGLVSETSSYSTCVPVGFIVHEEVQIGVFHHAVCVPDRWMHVPRIQPNLTMHHK